MLITLNQIPVTIQEFQTCPQLDLSKPENTCAMFLCALQLYIKDKDAGVEAMNMLRGPDLWLPMIFNFSETACGISLTCPWLILREQRLRIIILRHSPMY